jgi:hypothetical protein
MGSHPIKCYIGFSAKHVYPFSQELESYGSRMEAAFRAGHDRFLAGMARLHDAVDAAQAGDRATTEARLDESLALLDACSGHLGTIGESLAQSRRLLEAKAKECPEEPLVAREHFFATLDFERLHDELAAVGGMLPQQALWREMASAVARGGACEGLRLEEKTLRRLQGALRAYMARVEGLRSEPLVELAQRLHGMGVEVAGVMAQWLTFLGYATYLSVICERAMLLHEAAEAGAERATA